MLILGIESSCDETAASVCEDFRKIRSSVISTQIEEHKKYGGVVPEIASNEHFSKIDFRINRRPSSLPRVSDNAIDWERYIENRKSAVRCKVEHAFRIIKCQFGYKKTVYRGLKKNENRLYAMFACANLYALAIAGRKLSTFSCVSAYFPVQWKKQRITHCKGESLWKES